MERQTGPIDTRRRAEQVRERIIMLIQDRGLKPGEHLPTEPELMEEFGVGRSSVREAVQSLVGLGILKSRPGRGIYLKQVSVEDVTNLVSGVFSLSPAADIQVIEARAVIEIACGRLAALRRTTQDLELMSGAIAKTRKAIHDQDFEALADSEIEFHGAVVRATHNAVIIGMYEAVTSILRADRLEQYRGGRVPTETAEWHEKIRAAIEAGNPVVAANVLQQHMHL